MRLYWDPLENVPLVSRGCSREAFTVPISKVSDPRPAFDWDIKLLKGVLEAQFGAGAYEDLIINEVVLLGRAPYLDTSYEVIADGTVLGHLFFDIYEFKWYFRPDPPSIIRIGHRIERRSMYGRRGEEIGEAEPGDPKYLLLENGIAERIGNKYVVIKEFKKRIKEPLDVKNSWGKVISMNEPSVLSREFESIKMIWRLTKGRGVVVSFSGGKDSSVLLELARRSDINFLTYFNDTGLELPETISFVESTGCDIVGDAGDSFWRNLGHFGPPARDYRWCCKVIKLMPTYRALKHLRPGLTLVGQRRYESSARMRSPYLWRNEWLPGFLTAAPLNDWSNLQAWLYIRIRGLRINPLYFEGFERLGCYLCPASRLSDYIRLRERYSSLWERWEGFLMRYARERGYDTCWLTYGMWRWVDPPERMRKLCGTVREKPIKVSIDGTISVSELDYERFINLSRTSRSTMKVLKDRLILSEDPIEALRILVRANLCTGCGVCLEYCERKAIKLSEKASVGDSCDRCGLCNEVCPLSSYFMKLIDIS